MTAEELLLAWRTAERAAFKAEFELYKMGQFAADPKIGLMFAEAGNLRVEADRQFDHLVSVLVLNA